MQWTVVETDVKTRDKNTDMHGVLLRYRFFRCLIRELRNNTKAFRTYHAEYRGICIFRLVFLFAAGVHFLKYLSYGTLFAVLMLYGTAYGAAGDAS